MKEETMKKSDNAKMAYVHGGQLKNVDYNLLTLVDQFERNLQKNGNDGIYYYEREGNVEFNSYCQVKSNALRVLNGIKKVGIEPKNMVIFQSVKSNDFIDTFWACMYGGVVPVLASLPKSLGDIKATDSLTVLNIWKMLDKVKIFVSSDIFQEYFDFSKKIGIDTNVLVNIDDLRNNEETDEIYNVKPEDMSMMFFTSGSTGMPKGVIQTNKGAVLREYGELQLNQIKKDVLLNWMPLEHAGGVLMAHFRGIMSNSTQILVETDYILENPLRWLELIDKHRVNYSWAPHFAYVLINEIAEEYEGKWDLSCVDFLLDGGEMVHAKSGKQFLKNLKKYGLKSNVIRPSWGMCETCSGVLYNLEFDEDENAGVELVAKDISKGVIASKEEEGNYITAIGVPIPGCEMRVCNLNNETLTEDTVGRFLFRGEPVTKGYYKNEEVNKESFTDDGWFITGDLGFIHDGKMILTGREKDIIIVNGLNYNNVEIEAVIEENGNVEKSFTAVCAVADPETQQDIIIAFIVQRGNSDITLLCEEIKSQVFEKIKLHISHVIPVCEEDIPKTNLGKIQRAKLGKKFINGEFLAIEKNENENGEIFEQAENELRNALGINDIAVMSNRLADKLEYINTSSLNFGANSQCEEPSNHKDILESELLEKLESINFVKNITIEFEYGRTIVFFETGVQDIDFNIFVIKKMKDCILKYFKINNCVYVPISCNGLKDIKKEELVKMYKDGHFKGLEDKIDLSLGNDNTIPQWFYQEKAIEATIEREPIDSTNKQADFKILVCNNATLARRFVTYYAGEQTKIIIITDKSSNVVDFDSLCVKIEYVDVKNKESYEKILNKLSETVDNVDVIHLAGCHTYHAEEINTLENAQYMTVISIQNILQGFETVKMQLNKMLVVTANALSLENTENSNYAISTVSGYVKAAFDEGYAIKHIDLDSSSMEQIEDIVNNEFSVFGYNQLLYRKGVRYRIVLKNINILEHDSKIPLVKNGYYVITGGLGGIGVVIASVLLTRFNANLLLIGRSVLSEYNKEKNYAYHLLKEKVKEGTSVVYKACDIGNANNLEQVVSDYEQETGHQINGIIHLAGGIVEKLVKEQSVEELLTAYETKVFATQELCNLIKNRPDAILVTTSSARSMLPGITVSAYCSASEFNANISAYANNVLGIQTYCISWGQWDEIGMSKGLIIKNALEEKGFKLITKIWGQNSFVMALKIGKPYVFVGIDRTKNAIRNILHNEVESEEVLQIFTNYENVLDKENWFKSSVLEIIEKFDELKTMPKKFLILPSLPLDKNGFVDKNVLKERAKFLLGEAEILQPRNEFEQKVYDYWKNVFKSVEFGVLDNFFNLGGDSIKMIRLISFLKSAFDVNIKNQEIFKLTTVEQQANFIQAKCQEKNTYVTNTECIHEGKQKEEKTLLEEENKAILSAPQMRQWIMYEMDPGCPYYNNTIVITVKGVIIVPCIKMAVHQLIQRHDVLRTIYNQKDGKVYQEVKENVSIDIEQMDLSQYDEAQRQDKLNILFREEANKVIKIDIEPPIRASIININQGEALLLMSIHHIASDGWSMGILLQDISSIYSDILTYGCSKLPELTMQYTDFAKWQSEFIKSGEFKKQLDYWKEELVDVPPALELPYDEERKDYSENIGRRIIFEVDQKTTSTVKTLCKNKNCTLYMFLMSIFANLMQRYSNQEDMILGTLIANRNQEELQKMIGFFVNTMPIRLQFKSNESFESLLEQVKKKTLEMYDNQDVPFDVLVDELGTERESGKNPLFQVLFVVQNAQLESLKDNQAEWNLNILDSDTSKFDLIIQVFEIENKLSVKFEYDTNLFHDETIERWCKHFKKLIHEVIEDPNKQVGDYDIIDDEERKRILSINDNRTDYAKESNMYELFAETCKRVPTHIAVSSSTRKLTYKELKNRVDSLALHLLHEGIRHGDIVMIIADKTIEVVIGMLAILKSGSAYLPVTRKYPKEFLQYIVENSQTKYVLCNRVSENLDGIKGLNKIILDYEYEEEDSVEYEKIAPNDKAYVIYTSGSTGNPKGVVVSQQSVMRLVNKTDIYEFLEDDVVLQTGSLTFDVSVLEVWGALLNGAELRLVDEDIILDINLLKKEIVSSKASFMWISAPLFSMLVETDETLFETVKVLMVGGDVVSPKATNKVRKHNPNVIIINGYGPTENTSFSTVFRIEKDYEASIPIGQPISNSTAYVVNKNMKIQPIGVIGELVVGGDGVALGYLNQPELTKKVFIENPFEEGKTLYLTGDYARINTNGIIEFFGRIDGQVKVRGFRIELSAIERTLLQISGIEQALVRCVETGDSEKKILAYYTGQTEEDVRLALEQKLPEYMIPSYIMHLDAIPLNKNGKVDTKSLPKVSNMQQLNSTTEHKKPETEDEKVLFEIWSRMLGTSNFGINDNFFKLGGDSIMVIQLTNLIKQKGYDVNTKQVFKFQTIKSLALHLQKRDNQDIEEEKVSGISILGPIQKWFFKQNYSNINLWNLPLMIHFNMKHDSSVVLRALQKVVSYHDCLQCKFVNDNGDYMQVFGEKVPDVEIDIVDLTGANDMMERIANHCEMCQKKINIEKGALVSTVLFNDAQVQYLFIAVHHLVVDGISLRIIGEDIQKAIEDIENDKEIQIMRKTWSFKSWNEKLRDYSQNDAALTEYEYWKDIDGRIEHFISVEGSNTESNSSTKLVVLKSQVTETLTRKSGDAVGADVNHLLLAALVKTFREVFGIQNLPVRLEGHGREDIVYGVDITRTVGWFTTAYPVILESEESDNIIDIVIKTKEKLKSIPNKGIGYGILKYLNESEKIELSKEPQIVFNYLGEFDDRMEIGSREYGIFRDLGSERDVYLEFNVILQDDTLKIYLTLNNELLNKEGYNSLLNAYGENIKQIAEYCADLKERVHSPSDFELADLLSDQLKDIVKEYGQKIVDIYPLSFSQKGMLYHYLMETKSEDYFGQIHCPILGELNTEIFEMAWRQTVKENDILSTVYKWDGLAEPVQIVLNEKDITVDYKDARNQEESEDIYLERILKEDREDAFELTKLPLIRVKIIKMSNSTEFIFSFPHISLDGWSVFVILGEVMNNYQGIIDGDKFTDIIDGKGQYKDYIQWIFDQDLDKMKDFWKGYMAGFDEKNVIAGINNEGVECTRFIQKSFVLSKEEEIALTDKAREIGVTINTILQSALALVLRKFADTDDVLFGTTVSGRTPEIDNVNTITGLLINTLPFRVKVNGDQNVCDFIRSVQTNAFEIKDYESLSMADIKALSQIGNTNELFDILLVFENYPVDKAVSEGTKYISFGKFESHERTNYALTIVVVPEEELLIRFSYIEQIVDTKIIDAIMDAIKNVLMQLCMDTKTVDQIQLYDEGYTDIVLNNWSRNAEFEEMFEDQEDIYGVIQEENCDVEIYILDENMNVTALGVLGEIYIGIKDLKCIDSDWTEWMEENKVKNCISRSKYEYLYKTGDIGMWISERKIRFAE